MQKPTPLLKLALALPASLLLADVVLASPCDWVGGAAESTYSPTIQVISPSRHGLWAEVVPSSFSYSVGNGFIGVAIEAVEPQPVQTGFVRRLWGSAPKAWGVQVIGLLQNGPAQQAGLAQGDILLGVNGQRVTSVQQVQQIIQNTPVGQTVPITFRRGDQVLSTVVVVGDGQVLRPLMLQQQ